VLAKPGVNPIVDKKDVFDALKKLDNLIDGDNSLCDTSSCNSVMNRKTFFASLPIIVIYLLFVWMKRSTLLDRKATAKT
jgi:hypothetical protein